MCNIYSLIHILALSFTLAFAQGLQCWRCINARSDAHCQTIGRLQNCQRGQEMVCSTEIRRHRGFRRGRGAMITKRCKQSQACENGKRQNKSECRKQGRNSVCRCCCNNDICNKESSGCASAVTVGRSPRGNRCRVPPQAPTNGEMECKYKNFLGEINSSCMFLCREGYVLSGNEISTCLRRSSNSFPTFAPAPTCLPLTSPTETVIWNEERDQATTQTSNENICLDIPQSPPRGGRSCINIEDGTVCTYFCPDGEDVTGTASITCTNSKGWSDEPPRCGHRCEELSSGPPHGAKTCVGSGRVGTYCDFSCDPGYLLIGNSRLQCAMIIGRPTWDNSIPICRIDIPK